MAPLSASSEIVGDVPVGHRHVEVRAYEDRLAGDVGGEIVEGLEVRHDPYRNFAITPAVSIMRFEKPHSLSYHAITLTMSPSMTRVSPAS